MTLFCMFLVGGYIWRNPREHRGEHANTERPFFSDEIAHLGPGGNRSQDLLVVRRQLYH